jgi:hypothetical protein
MQGLNNALQDVSKAISEKLRPSSSLRRSERSTAIRWLIFCWTRLATPASLT